MMVKATTKIEETKRVDPASETAVKPTKKEKKATGIIGKLTKKRATGADTDAAKKEAIGSESELPKLTETPPMKPPETKNTAVKSVTKKIAKPSTDKQTETKKESSSASTTEDKSPVRSKIKKSPKKEPTTISNPPGLTRSVPEETSKTVVKPDSQKKKAVSTKPTSEKKEVSRESAETIKSPVKAKALKSPKKTTICATPNAPPSVEPALIAGEKKEPAEKKRSTKKPSGASKPPVKSTTHTSPKETTHPAIGEATLNVDPPLTAGEPMKKKSTKKSTGAKKSNIKSKTRSVVERETLGTDRAALSPPSAEVMESLRMGLPGISSKKSAATASKSPVPARGNNNRLPSHDLDRVMPQVPKRPKPQIKTVAITGAVHVAQVVSSMNAKRDLQMRTLTPDGLTYYPEDRQSMPLPSSFDDDRVTLLMRASLGLPSQNKKAHDQLKHDGKAKKQTAESHTIDTVAITDEILQQDLQKTTVIDGPMYYLEDHQHPPSVEQECVSPPKTTSTMERYQIALHAKNLPNKGGLFRRSSPYAQVQIMQGPDTGKDLGQTEPIQHTLSPDWVKIFIISADPSIIVRFKVTIWDYRGENKEPIYMGEAEYGVSNVYSEKGKMKNETIGKRGKLHCHVEQCRMGDSHGSLQLHLRGLDIKNVEPGPFGLGRSDPFFEVAKKDSDYSIGLTQWNVIYRSEHIDNHLNPFWTPCLIGLENLCYGDLSWPLKISVFDHSDNGKHKLIGEYECTVGELLQVVSIKGNADRDKALHLSTEEKAAKGKSYGLLVVLKAELIESSTSGGV